MTGTTLNLGLIGCGSVGQLHLESWQNIPGCRIVAAADLRPALLSRVGEKFGVERLHCDHRALLEDPDIHAVIVVTHRDQTASVVFDCLKAGKHVFSEKPMAKTYEQGARLLKLAEQNNLRYLVGYQRRVDEGTQVARKAFEQLRRSGELGAIRSVRAWNFTGKDRYTNAGLIMTDESRPEGLKPWESHPSWIGSQYSQAYDRFVNVITHDTNLHRYFFQKPMRVLSADLRDLGQQRFDLEYPGFSLRFEGGFEELKDWSERGDWDEGLEIVFEAGSLLIRISPPLMLDRCSRVELRKEMEVQTLSDGNTQAFAFRREGEQFVNWISKGIEPENPALDALEDLAVSEAIWQHFLAKRV